MFCYRRSLITDLVTILYDVMNLIDILVRNPGGGYAAGLIAVLCLATGNTAVTTNWMTV